MSIPKAEPIPRAWHWVDSGPIFLGSGLSAMAMIRSHNLFGPVLAEPRISEAMRRLLCGTEVTKIDVFLDKVPRWSPEHITTAPAGETAHGSQLRVDGCLRIDTGTSCYETSTSLYW